MPFISCMPYDKLLAKLCFSFLIYQMRTVIAHTLQSKYKNQMT